VVLSDITIARLIDEGRIGIDPYDKALLQPSSVDVRVDRYFRVFHNARYAFIDVKQPQEELTEEVAIDDDRPFILHPGEFVLGSTAGFIDPGWDGHVTLELSNVANLPITIYHRMKIGQISFMQLSEPTSTPYGSSSLGSKYQGQRGPTPSRYWQNFVE
jgi:dCTP deaminase